MSKTAKIAISLPQDLLQGIEKERLARGETRSEFFRRAIEAYISSERELEERYARGYREHPETPEEMVFAESTVQYSTSLSPWEEDVEE